MVTQITIIVLCSLGGNTLRAARLFARGLQNTDATAHVRILEPALPLSPAARRTTLTDPAVAAAAAARDTAIAASVAASAAVAVMAPVFAYDVPPGTVAWLRAVLPPLDGRVCVAACTYGTLAGAAPAVLARTLADRGGRVVAAHALRTPDTFAWFLPRAGAAPVRWPAATHTACHDAGAHLAHVLATGCGEVEGCAVPTEPCGPSWAARTLAAMPYASTRAMTGPVRVDAQRCVRCGACTLRCPTGALRMRSAGGTTDVEDVAGPVWEEARCVGCAQCAGQCTRGALTVGTLGARGAAFPVRRGAGRVPREVETAAVSEAEDTALAEACADARAWRGEYAGEWARFLCVAATHPLAALRAVWAFLVGVVVTVVLGTWPMKSTPQEEKEEEAQDCHDE